MNQNQNYDALLDDNHPPATMHDSSPHARATPISAIIGNNNNPYQNNYHNHNHNNNNNEYIEYPIEPGSTGGPTRRGPISDNMDHESSRSPQRPQRQKSKQEKLDEFAEIARKLEEAPSDHAEAMRSRYEMPYQVAVAILIVATMVLFVYSNRSLGAGVKLTVTPIVNIDNNNVNTDDTTTYYYYNSNQNMISIVESLLDISKEYPIIKNFNVITNSNSNSNSKQDISASEMLSYMAVSEIDSLFNLNSHSNNDNNNSSDIISMSIDDLPTYSATVFTFTLVSSIEDFVNADAWALAIVIAGFSGIWPYIKLISLLWIWMLPVSANKRDWGLLFLDQFGKFSFVDLFVTMFMVVSFYVRITEQLETVGISLGITVEPDIGLMTFVLGTLLSMAWTHIFIYLDAKNHRSIKVNGKRRRRYSSILVIAPSRYPLEMPDNMQDIDYYDNDQTRNDNNNNKKDKKNKNKKNKNKKNNKNRNENETAPSVAHSRADTNSTDLTSIQYPQSVKNNVYYYNNNNDNNNNNNYYNNQNNNNNDFDAMSQITDIETENAVLFHHFPQKGSKLHQWQNSHEYNNRSKYQIFALYHTPKSFIGIFFRSLFLVSIIANIYLLITVIITAPVKYTLDGIIAKFIDNPIRAYSVLEVANMLPHKTDQIEYAYMLQVVYYVSAIITPVIVAVLIVFVWLLPSTWYMHKFILHIILPIQAWAALDVFFIGSLAASLELEQVSEWIINSNFAGVCGPHGTIENIVHMGCFSVKGELTIGTWLMLISVTFLWFSLVYTVKNVKLAHNELGINQRLMKKMIWKQKQLEKEYSKQNEINQYNNLIRSSNYPNNNNNNNKAYHRNMDAQSDVNTAYGSDDQYAM